MFSSLIHTLIVAALAVRVLGTSEVDGPTRTTPLQAHIYPHDITPRGLFMNPAVPLTNAQRFARGFPPNRPHRRAHARRASPSPSPSPSPSSGCAQMRGFIGAAVNGPGGSVSNGFLSRFVDDFGVYEFTTSPTDALLVSFCRDSTNSNKYFDLKALNGLADFTYVGGVVGAASTDDGFAPGSFNYAYLAGTYSVERGPAVAAPNSFSAASTFQEHVESAIWRLGPSNELIPSWVNVDGLSAPATQIVYYHQLGLFTLVGDVTAFRGNFGEGDITTFTFIPQ